MRSRPRMLDALHLIARAGLGGLLLWSGLTKAFDPQGSLLAVSGYDVLPAGFVEPVALGLPWIEIVLGALLLTGLFVRQAAIGATLLLTAFIAGMLQAKARGLRIDCGCFGGGGAGSGVSWLDVLRDLPLLAAAAFLALRPDGPWALDRTLRAEDDDGNLIEAEG